MLPTYIATRGGHIVALVGPPLRYCCQFSIPHLRRQKCFFNIPWNNNTNWNTTNIHCSDITECQSFHPSTNKSINKSINPIPSICLNYLSVCRSVCVTFRSSFIPLSLFVLSLRKPCTPETNNTKSHIDMFEQRHVKCRLADIVPKHPTHLQMPCSTQAPSNCCTANKELVYRSEGRQCEILREILQVTAVC